MNAMELLQNVQEDNLPVTRELLVSRLYNSLGSDFRPNDYFYDEKEHTLCRWLNNYAGTVWVFGIDQYGLLYKRILEDSNEVNHLELYYKDRWYSLDNMADTYGYFMLDNVLYMVTYESLTLEGPTISIINVESCQLLHTFICKDTKCCDCDKVNSKILELCNGSYREHRTCNSNWEFVPGIDIIIEVSYQEQIVFIFRVEHTHEQILLELHF